MTAPALHIEGLEFAWPGAAGFAIACDGFTVAPGETVLLLGASGSGKSTLLSLICGTLTPQRGRVEIAGCDIAAMRPRHRDRFRAEAIGIIFQQFNLLPYASVCDNICLPLLFAPKRRARMVDPREEAARLCRELDLPEDTLGHAAGQLSVGQQQRVAIARALIGAPTLVVADEPTSALDAATQDSFLAVLFARARANGTAVLMVSHDARIAGRFDRVVELSRIARSPVAP